MKIKIEIAVCFLIILFIIFIDLIINNHFIIEKRNMDKVLSELQDIIIKNDDGKEKMEELNNKWNEFDKLAAFYTEHNELEKISLKVCLVNKKIEINDTEMIVEYLEEIKFMLNHIYEKDKLKLINIF